VNSPPDSSAALRLSCSTDELQEAYQNWLSSLALQVFALRCLDSTQQLPLALDVSNRSMVLDQTLEAVEADFQKPHFGINQDCSALSNPIQEHRATRNHELPGHGPNISICQQRTFPLSLLALRKSKYSIITS